jgi:hypothetical protein
LRDEEDDFKENASTKPFQKILLNKKLSKTTTKRKKWWRKNL